MMATFLRCMMSYLVGYDGTAGGSGISGDDHAAIV